MRTGIIFIIALISVSACKMYKSTDNKSTPNSLINEFYRMHQLDSSLNNLDSSGIINGFVEINYLDKIYCFRVNNGVLQEKIVIKSEKNESIVYENYICYPDSIKLTPEKIDVGFLQELKRGLKDRPFLSYHFIENNIKSVSYKGYGWNSNMFYNPRGYYYSFYKTNTIKFIYAQNSSADSLYYFDRSKRLKKIKVKQGNIEKKIKGFCKKDFKVYNDKAELLKSFKESFFKDCLVYKYNLKLNRNVLRKTP